MSGLPYAKKSLGQHWLSDEASLNAMCDAAKLTSRDTVLEIGSGSGTLTRQLVKRAGTVIAVEKDEALAQQLTSEEFAKKLQIVEGDILEFDTTSLPLGYKVVANIPYYLTSNLIRILSESSNPPQTCVLLVQKEVAARAAAAPGKMSLLAVSAQLYWDVSLGRVVSAKLFVPPPKVDSQILVLRRREQPLFLDVSPKQILRLAKAGFSNRRKTLHNSLSAGLAISKDQAKSLLEHASLHTGQRAQELSLEDWHRLSKSAENK